MQFISKYGSFKSATIKILHIYFVYNFVEFPSFFFFKINRSLQYIFEILIKVQIEGSRETKFD